MFEGISIGLQELLSTTGITGFLQQGGWGNFVMILVGFVLLYLFAYLVKNDILYPGVPKDSYVVLTMFDGSLLNYLFPEMTLTPMIETMTTVGLLLIAFLLSLGLYFANQKFFKGKEENILECGIYPWLKKYSADEDEIRR